MVLLDCFWALGACLEVLLAAAVMPWGGWRLLLAISALPALAFVFAAATWVPESARFNAARGEVIRRKNKIIPHLNKHYFPIFRPTWPWTPLSAWLPRTASPWSSVA